MKVRDLVVEEEVKVLQKMMLEVLEVLVVVVVRGDNLKQGDGNDSIFLHIQPSIVVPKFHHPFFHNSGQSQHFE